MMAYTRSRRHAFTLIELLIAIAAASAIVLVATAGVRGAMRSMLLAKSLTLETDLINISMMAAFDELDHWDDCMAKNDARFHAEAIPAPGANGACWLGTPFTPFRSKAVGEPWPDANHGYVRGWVEDEASWAITADNERTWWTASPVENNSSDCRFGRWAILGSSRKPTPDPSFPVESSVQAGARNYGVIRLPSRDGRTGGRKTEHWSWLFDQSRMLGDALGWYGMLDYLPANSFAITPWAHTQNGLLATAANGFPRIWYQSTSRGSITPYFVLMQHGTSVSPGLDFLTDLTCYTLTPMSLNALTVHGGGEVDMAECILHNRFQTVTNLGNAANNDSFRDIQKNGQVVSAAQDRQVMERFLLRSNTGRNIMDVRPQEWPSLETQVGRYLTVCRFQNQIQVGWSRPTTGENVAFRFSAMGTTLRGARRQRGLDR